MMDDEAVPSMGELQGLMYLDPSWFDIIKIKANSLPIKAWMSFKPFKGYKGVHGEIVHVGTESPPEILSSNGFQVESHGKFHLDLSFAGRHRVRFVGPKDVFASIHHSNVINMDVSRGGIGVSLGKEGKLSVFRIWESNSGIIRRELQGHHGYGYSCRLFPSGIVVLTGGADMMLNIWSAETGISHRSLKGHTGAVHDSAIVGLGKNVISISNDSTVRLWNCGSGSCLDILCKVADVPICCEITDFKFHNSTREPLEGEISTDNKLLVVGCENGLVMGLNVYERSVAFTCKLESGVKDLKFYGENCGLFIGCENGFLHKYSLNAGDDGPSLKLERIWEDSESSIESLLVVHDGVFVGRRDGSCIWYSENHDIDSKRISLVGADADPIYCMAKDDSSIYTGARDGKIRKYLLTHIFKS